jgi:hypothetical protein
MEIDRKHTYNIYLIPLHVVYVNTNMATVGMFEAILTNLEEAEYVLMEL